MNKENKNEKGMSNKKWKIIIIVIIIFSFAAPAIFTIQCSWIPNWFPNFMSTGQVGDTIGGLMNPFISIAIVVVTWLAFNEQYKANQEQIKALEEQKRQFEEEQRQQRKNIELQKFENQFYEMLRLHKENVNEIGVKNYDGQKVIRGRDVFYQLKLEFEILLNSLNYFKKDKVEPLDANILYDMYDVFFFGLNIKVLGKEESKEQDSLLKFLEEDVLIRSRNKRQKSEKYKEWEISLYNNKYTVYRVEHYNSFEPIKFQDKLGNDIKEIGLQIPLFKGHHTYLAHYYRNLFHLVTYVVEKDFLDKQEKLNYLDILRSQLSNYEQIMLFYNWLSGYGKEWEDEQNHFFTEYKMIKNLWYDILYHESFIKEKLKELVKKYKEQGGEGNLFEIGDDIDKNFS